MTSTEPVVLLCEQVRFVDRYAIETLQIPGLVLMENAGRGCVDWLQELGCTGPILVLCGPGNNGGDGFVIARHLQIRGIEVGVLLLSDPQKLRGDAQANWQICQHLDLPVDRVEATEDSTALRQRLEAMFEGRQPNWIVDAMLGTGSRGPLRQPYRSTVELVNTLPAHRFAVDIPSGLDAELGLQHSPVFQADATATFVAAKPGLVVDAAKPTVGQLRVLDIGLPDLLIQRALKAFSAR